MSAARIMLVAPPRRAHRRLQRSRRGPGGGSSGPIQVGLLVPTSGTVAAAGTDMVNGWDLWFKLHGKHRRRATIEASHEDTAGDPTMTLTKARKLVEQDGARRSSSARCWPTRPTRWPATSSRTAGHRRAEPGRLVRRPQRSASASTTTSAPAAGRARPRPTRPGDWAADQGWKRVDHALHDYAFGYENCGGFINTFTDHGGEVVKQLYAPLGTSDYTSYLAQIDPDEVDGVFVQTVGADSPRFLAAWDGLGLKGKVPLIANETTVEQSALRTIKGDDPLGLQSFAHYAEGREEPATAEFVREFKKAYGTRPSYYACATYTAAQWMTEALEETGGDISDAERSSRRSTASSSRTPASARCSSTSGAAPSPTCTCARSCATRTAGSSTRSSGRTRTSASSGSTTRRRSWSSPSTRAGTRARTGRSDDRRPPARRGHRRYGGVCAVDDVSL